MKACTQCGVERPLEGFARDSRKGDGRKSECKDCHNAWKRGRPAEVKRMERQSYIQRNRHQHAAQRAVRKAVARGTLVRPDVCEGCSALGPVEAHHDDYSQRFTVRWLCKACHAATHMARVRVDLRLPEELVAAVDEARGDVTRTRWIERALERALGERGAESGAKAGESREVPRTSQGPVAGDPAPPRASEKDSPAIPKIAKRHWA